MKIITDGFQALDAMEHAAKEGCTFTVTLNTITAKNKLLPKLALFQIRTKGMDQDTQNHIKEKYLNK